MSALASQIGGRHYKDCKIQPVQYIEANGLKFLEACVVKRVTRHDKPTGKGRQDIEKAIHELQLLLELRYGSLERTKVPEGYMLCPYCKEVTRKDVVACIQCGEAVNYDEERMDVIGQNGNDGEHYGVPERPVWWVDFKYGKTAVPAPTVSVYLKWDDGHESKKPVMVGEAPWSSLVVAYRLA